MDTTSFACIVSNSSTRETSLGTILETYALNGFSSFARLRNLPEPAFRLIFALVMGHSELIGCSYKFKCFVEFTNFFCEIGLHFISFFFEMPKRKTVEVPTLWKVGQLYLFPLAENQYATVEYRKFRQEYPDTQVLFLKNSHNFMEAILSEMANSSQFKEKDSHYYIAPARVMGAFSQEITVGKHTLTWNGSQLMCLGSQVCTKCFLQGILHPYTCANHLQCFHGKPRVRSCDACVAKTLLGFWKDRIDCYQGDTNSCFAIARCSHKMVSFKCAECKHVFEISPGSLVHNNAWCSYCSSPPKQLCNEEACQSCYAKSFASHQDRSKFWHSILNLPLTARQVFKNSPKKYWFSCGTCRHDFEVPLNDLVKERWCPYCSNPPRKLCGLETCQSCYQKSFASHEKIQFWCSLKNDPVIPTQVFKGSSDKYWFTCEKCKHDFNTALVDISSSGNWCPFCSSPPKRLCSNECSVCFSKSFASHDRAVCWTYSKNSKTPREVFKRSNKKFWFTCDLCFHNFNTALTSITSGIWCPFCASQKLCDLDTCQSCFDKSFSNHVKSTFWHSTKNLPVTPRQVFKQSSNNKYWFHCAACNHEFDAKLANIVSLGQWCPFCAHTVLCNNDTCQRCHEISFASDENSKYWHPTKNASVTPRQVFRQSSNKYWFHCAACDHDFDATLAALAQGGWCPFCSHHRRCDKPSCATCAQSCDVCKSKKAQTKTRITRTWVCWDCLKDAVLRDPKEQPLITRAKVSLEMYLLGEILYSNDFFLNEPTSWDCSILPGLAFKPDCIWCFDESGEVVQMGSANKLNLGIVKYALQVEILEDSRSAHSKARDISDEEREVEIRGLFGSQQIPIGFVYVTMAHTKHFNAHPDDVFFAKPEPNKEYQVLASRRDAWLVRVREVQEAILKMFDEKSNETIFIGN